MADVFISYALDDSGIANELADELALRGISVFFDRETLVAGTNFREEIAQELRSSKAVVVLLSENTKRSSWVQEELSSVIERADGPKVIPVLLDGHAKENWVWPLVSDRVAVDLSTRRDKLSEVALQLARLLPQQKPGPQTSSPRAKWGIGYFLAAVILVAVAASSVFFLSPAAPLSSFEPTTLPFSLWILLPLIGGAIGFLIGYLFSKWRK